MDDRQYPFYKKAIVFHEMARYREVVTLLGPHLQELHDSYIFFHALYQLKRFDELLHLSEGIGPDSCQYIAILHLRASSFNNLHNTERALDDISKAVNLAPDDAWGHYILAHIKYGLGECASAYRSVMLAIGIASENACFHKLQANIYYSLRQFALAKTALEKAASIDPEDDETLFELSLFRGKRHDKLQLLASAVRINPTESIYRVQYKALYHAFPWWLQPKEYPVRIAKPLQVVLALSCFMFAFFNPVLTQCIENIKDPIFVHHALYLLSFVLIANNIWLAELLLVLCVTLFSREIFCVYSEKQIIIFSFQLIGSVLLLPFVKPIIFNLRECYLEFMLSLRSLFRSDWFRKSLCIFLRRQLSVVIPWITAISFLAGITHNLDLLLFVGCWPLYLGLYLPYLLLLAFIADQDKSLYQWFTEICMLFFPWLSIYIVYYLQLIFAALLLTIPVIHQLGLPLCIFLGFIVSKSTVRFIRLVSD